MDDEVTIQDINMEDSMYLRHRHDHKGHEGRKEHHEDRDEEHEDRDEEHEERDEEHRGRHGDDDDEEEEEEEGRHFRIIGIVLLHIVALGLFTACYGGVLCCFKSYQRAVSSLSTFINQQPVAYVSHQPAGAVIQSVPVGHVIGGVRHSDE